MFQKISRLFGTKRIKPIILYIITLFIFFFFLNPPVKADENFTVSHDITFTFDETSLCEINQTVTIINKNTNVYPTEYQINIFGKIVGEIITRDQSGPLRNNLDNTDANITKITIFFDRKNVGLGNRMVFYIDYHQEGFVSQLGTTKEIVLPKINKENNPDLYNITVKIPRWYGKIAYIKPNNSYNENDDYYQFIYEKNTARSGLIIGFGERGIYEMDLNYYLNNNSLIPKVEEIYLPPDTSFQEVYFKEISPQPSSIKIDDDGNWSAYYKLKPRSDLNINVKGVVQVFAQGKPVKTANPDKYIIEQPYWEVNDSVITKTTAKLSNAQDIYNYVVSNFKYDYQKINNSNKRLGAKNALLNPDNSICMEFTDTFIALARALKIPSREINGFAYTINNELQPVSVSGDILHSWPEYWNDNKKIWQSIDPTWGNTTGGLEYFSSWDFNHIALVIHASSSDYPLSVGSYKKNLNDKSININPITDFKIPEKKEIVSKFIVPGIILPFTSIPVTIEVSNPNGFSIYNIPVDFKAEGYKLTISNDIIDLPPFGSQKISTKLYSPNAKFLKNIEVVATVDEKMLNYQLKTDFSNIILIIIFIFIIFILLLIIFIKNHDRKRKN